MVRLSLAKDIGSSLKREMPTSEPQTPSLKREIPSLEPETSDLK